MPKKQTKEIAKINDSFAVAKPAEFELDADVFDAISDEDFGGYEDTGIQLPFVSIRQKDVKENRKVIRSAGDFKINEAEVADVDGEKGLIVSILSDKISRTYWESVGDDRPKCKSIDGITGTQFGLCDSCEFSKFGEDGSRPKCGSHFNLLCYDNANGSCYIFQTSPSGIKPYKQLKTAIKQMGNTKGGKTKKIPMFVMKIRITTEEVAEPAPHFIPKFEIVETVSIEMMQLLKTNKDSFDTLFGSRIKETEIKNIDDQTDTGVDTEFDPPDDDLSNDEELKRINAWKIKIRNAVALLHQKEIDIPKGVQNDVGAFMEYPTPTEVEFNFNLNALNELFENKYDEAGQ